MKKLTAMLLSVLLAFSLTACGNNNQNRREGTQAKSQTTDGASEPEDNSQ